MAVETTLEKGGERPLSEVEAPIAGASMVEAPMVPGSGESGDLVSVVPTPKKGTSHSRSSSLSAGMRSLFGSMRRSAPQ